MNRLTKVEIKNEIITFVSSRLWVLNKECLLNICKGLNIECAANSTKDELIENIKDAGLKKKSIFLDIYNEYNSSWGYSPGEVEQMLNLTKSKRQELTKCSKLKISYYYESRAYGKYLSTPMYDIQFILSKMGTDYVDNALEDINKVKDSEKKKKLLEKKKMDKAKSKIEKEIEKIDANNIRKLNKLLKEVKGIHFIDNSKDLNKYINSDTDNSVRECNLGSLESYIESLDITKLKASLWTKDKRLFVLKDIDISISNKRTSRILELNSDLNIVLNKEDNSIQTYIKINSIDVKSTRPIEANMKDLPSYKKIVLDTETTGLYPGTDQIAQLSYIILNKDNMVIGSKNYYFQVDNMEDEAECIHGLSIPLLRELSLGKVFKDHAEEIYHDINNADLIICHNSDFDIGFINSEFSRVGKEVVFKKEFCTMEYYTDILKIEHYYGYKWPKLEEVVDYLGIGRTKLIEATKRVFSISSNNIGYHDSRVDVTATAGIYIRTIKENKTC